MKRPVWVIMTVLATTIAAYTAAVLLLPAFGPPFIHERRGEMPLAVVGHLTGGLIALALGAWQLNERLRERVIQVHRWMGRAYVLAVLVGGVSALRLAPFTQEGMVTHLGFGALAALWLWTTGLAYVAIRSGDQARHRRWMIRSYSLTLAAVTLRIYLPLFLVSGAEFGDAYKIIAWLCWVPNLLAAELLLRRGAPRLSVAGR